VKVFVDFTTKGDRTLELGGRHAHTHMFPPSETPGKVPGLHIAYYISNRIQ
jgi:hypothetical protein